MHFTCTQENLLKGLTQVAPIAGRNTQLPILQHILLQVRDSVLHLTTTDLEVGVHTIVGGKIETEGKCTVIARRLLEYVQQLPPTHPLELVVKEGKLFVTTRGFRAQFPIADAEDFPLLPSPGSGPKISLAADQVCEGLAHTIFSAAREETRPEIHSVFLKGEERELRIAATDSFRLSEVVISLPEERNFSLLLPLSAAGEVVRLFSSSEQLQLLPQENHAVFSGEGLELSSRLVDGNYPDYRQIIPQSWKTKVTVKRSELLRALKTLTVFLPRDSRRILVHIEPKKEELVLRVEGSEAGQGEVTLQTEMEGQPIDILFNIQYLLEGVQHITEQDCQLQLSGPQDPAIFRPLAADNHYLYVVMPIQL